MLRASLVIAFVGIFLDCAIAVDRPLSAKESSKMQINCDPVGRVYSEGNSEFLYGTLLCKGTRLQLLPGKKVTVLCYAAKNWITFSMSATLSGNNECLRSGNRQNSFTIDGSRSYSDPKGPGEDRNAPVILSPYSDVLLNCRPFISWRPTIGAIGYIVKVDGTDIHWEESIVKGTTLPYPGYQSALSLGNAYAITIVAKLSNSHALQSSSLFNILSIKDARQVMDDVKQVKSLNLPKDEEAYLDLDAIYMSKKLLTETINTLEERVKAGSTNPGVYRVLGEHYLEIGLIAQAKLDFEIASRLAKVTPNPTERVNAQVELRKIKQWNNN